MLTLPSFVNQHVALDIESTGLYPNEGAVITMVGLAWEGGSTCIPFRATEAENLGSEDWWRLLRWLRVQKLILQNGKFDLLFFILDEWGGIDLSNDFFWDTLLGSELLWPLEDHGLKPTSERLFGIEVNEEYIAKQVYMKEHKLKTSEFAKVPFDIQGRYCEEDAKNTYRLHGVQKRLFTADSELFMLFKREMDLAKVLLGMERRGIGFNAKKAVEIGNILSSRKILLEKALPFRPTRQQAVKYWWGEDELAPSWLPRTEKTKQVQINADSLEILAGKGYDNAENFAEWTFLRDMLSKYYGSEGWPSRVGKDGRLRVSYTQNGAISGRLSAKRVNLQAIPRDNTLKYDVPSIRNLFIPKPGHVLIGLDISQAEIRIGAKVSGCRKMLEAIDSGQDLHGVTAEGLFRTTADSPQWERQRWVAKQVNLMVQYGAGPKMIAWYLNSKGRKLGLQMTIPQAAALKERYDSLYPEIRTCMEAAKQRVEDRGWVKMINGRKRWYKDYEPTFKAFNSVIQGNVAEAVKTWMIWTNRQHPETLLLQVHDEIILELPETAWKGIALEIKNYGENFMTELFRVPIKIDIKEYGGHN